MLFTVHFRDARAENDGKKVLETKDISFSIIEDKKSGNLVRDVAVTEKESGDLQQAGKFLKLFGSVHKKLVFEVMIEDDEPKNKALGVVKALRGVDKAEFEHGTPLTLNVAGKDGDTDPDGDPDPKVVLEILKKYAAPFARALYG